MDSVSDREVEGTAEARVAGEVLDGVRGVVIGAGHEPVQRQIQGGVHLRGGEGRGGARATAMEDTRVEHVAEEGEGVLGVGLTHDLETARRADLGQDLGLHGLEVGDAAVCRGVYNRVSTSCFAPFPPP